MTGINGPLQKNTSNHAFTNAVALISLLLPDFVQRKFFAHEDSPRAVRGFLDASSNISAHYPLIVDKKGQILGHATDDSSTNTFEGNL